MERRDKVLVRITKAGSNYASSLKAGQFRTAKLGNTSTRLAYIYVDGLIYTLLHTDLDGCKTVECIVIKRIK
jgi:hypothetical protein